jgi:hypothetical protein
MAFKQGIKIKLLLTNKANISSLTGLYTFSYPTFYQHFIRRFADSPVRDLMWVERKLTPFVTKSHRGVTITRHSANS